MFLSVRFRWLTAFAAVAVAAVVAAPAIADASRAARVVIWEGYGTPDHVVAQGRVLLDEKVLPDVERGWLENVSENIGLFETDEVPGVVLDIAIETARYTATTDADGIFRIEATDLRPTLKPGVARVVAALRAGQVASAPRVQGKIFVLPKSPGVLVISDFDDTVVQSFVRDRARLLETAFTKNSAQLAPVPGAPAAYRNARDAGALGFFYLSGSPINFHERIRGFLEQHDFPPGPLLLKNLGADPVFDQEGYKPRKIDEVIARFPMHRFILIGDSGEKDPEIYRAARARHGDRVAAIVIRIAAGTSPDEHARFTGMTVVDDYGSDAGTLAALITAARAPVATSPSPALPTAAPVVPTGAPATHP